MFQRGAPRLSLQCCCWHLSWQLSYTVCRKCSREVHPDSHFSVAVDTCHDSWATQCVGSVPERCTQTLTSVLLLTLVMTIKSSMHCLGNRCSREVHTESHFSVTIDTSHEIWATRCLVSVPEPCTQTIISMSLLTHHNSWVTKGRQSSAPRLSLHRNYWHLSWQLGYRSVTEWCTQNLTSILLSVFIMIAKLQSLQMCDRAVHPESHFSVPVNTCHNSQDKKSMTEWCTQDLTST